MKIPAGLSVTRLCDAMRHARLSLQRYRENRRMMVRQYVGKHWSEEGTSERVPTNLIALYVSIIGRNLIAKNPRVLISTFNRANKSVVSAMQDWANDEIERMALAETLQRVVVDGLFSLGICKVALADPALAATRAWHLEAGQPFAQDIDLDDFVYDVHARSFQEVGFMGHRYRVPLEVVRDSKIYSKARKDLAPSSHSQYNLEGDERIGVLGRGTYGQDSEEYEDFVDLWEVYLPRHRLVLTLADDNLTGPSGRGVGSDTEPLRVQGWVGPEKGPYHLLAYQIVPGNAMPKGPIQDLFDLHEASNSAHRKFMRMIERMKEVGAVQGSAAEDGERVMHANDGEIIRVDRPDSIRQMVFGGTAAQPVLAGATVFKDLFAYFAGNLDMMGGLSPQSKTLGQDQMLAQNASRSVADMQDQTVSFTASVVEALCWYWYNDPFKVQRSIHALPGLPEMAIARQVTPEMRQQGKFEDLKVRVDPYSLQHATPQSRLAALNQVVQQIIMPMQPILQQSGVVFDVHAYLRKVGEYADQPDIMDIVTVQEPPQSEVSSGGPDAPTMPNQTERRYVRENRSSQTREASDRNLVSSMLGVNTGGNPQETAKS